MDQPLAFRRIEHDFSDLNDLLNSLNSCKPERVHFVTCPKQGREMEAVVLHKVRFLAYPCSKQGSGFQTLSGTPIPKHGSSNPPPPRGLRILFLVDVTHSDLRLVTFDNI